MPIARPDTARTARGVPIVIAVVANDEGGNLMISGYTQPTAGTLALNPDRTFTYTPGPAFEGIDGFAYTIRDGVGGTAEGDVRIFVARPNTVPQAANDAATVELGASVAIPVLANDGDADGDPLAIIGLDAPAHGTITVLPDQSIRYAPQADFAGIDSFTYTVGDGQGGTAEASVTITVTVPNRPPVAQPDRATTVAGSPVTIDALANDNDPEGNPVALAGMEMPGQGSLALTADNRFVYMPRPGFVGEDSFSYTIRDSAGATARGDVTVTVTPRNAPPTAVPDNLTSDGAAVTFDPLANDSDADGDPLQLKSLTMPLSGRVALGADGRVTYTPPTGFTGADGFTYQVGDGRAVSEAEVSISVTAPALPTYANGYRYRRRIVVPPQTTAAETATDFVLLVQESGGWLKSAVAGGRIEHAQGFDLRFEIEDGTKLDHELERYDATAGSLLAWIRIPSWDLATQLRLNLYCGKPGLTATEANPTAVWAGYLAVLDARTGVDRSGANRGFIPTGITAGTLLGDAGVYSGTAVATRADASFLSGKSALTVQALVSPAAATVGSNHGVLAQGPMNGTDTAAGLTLQYLTQSGNGTRNVVHFKVAASDGAAFVVSGADAQRTGTQLLHGVWRQGEAARLYLDGSEQESSSSSAIRTGVTAMATGSLYLGAGARDPATGGWVGLIDEVRFAAAAFSPARIAAEARNLGSLQALYGLGGEDQPAQTDNAPVAVPLTAAVTAGNSVDIDVAARAYDPDGPGLPEVVGVGAPAHGVVTVVAGKVRYTAFAGYVGSDSFGYTLDNAGKRSASVVLVDVAANAGTPKYPPAALRTLRVPEDYADLAGAVAAARAGDHISLADGVYNGNLTIDRSGSAAGGYIVVKARNHRRAVITGHWVLTGDYVWLTGLTMQRPGQDPGSNNNAAYETPSFYSIWFRGKNQLVTNCRVDSTNGLRIAADPGFRTENISVCFNDFTSRTAPRFRQANCIYLGDFVDSSAGPNNVLITRNKWYDDLDRTDTGSGERYCIYTGNSHPKNNNAGNNRSVVITENFAQPQYVVNGFYMKRGYEVTRNFIRMAGASRVALTLRHGGYSRSDGTVFTNPPLTDDKRAIFAANNVDQGAVIINDTDHLLIGNRFTGNLTMRCGATVNGTEQAAQAASRCILVGNTLAKLTVGSLQSDNHVLDATQGGVVNGVKNYAAGIAQPTGSNLIRENVVAGTAGYQELTGNGGYTPSPYVLRVELENTTGCDPAV